MVKKSINNIIVGFLLCNNLICASTVSVTDPIDVVIPCHEKDLRTLELCIQSIRKHGKGIRRIIVISEKKLTENAEWFPETQYPFSRQDVLDEIFNGDKKLAEEYAKLPGSRLGWIFQQLLKLYAPLVIPNISSNVLMLDSDVVFLRDVVFIDNEGNALFNFSKEDHEPYFEHAKKLISGPYEIKRVYKDKSGICHHMLFQRYILEELFECITQTHKTEPWRALCRCIDREYIYNNKSALSEYEIYFNFAFGHSHAVKIRHLPYKDAKFSKESIEWAKKQGLYYVALHTWWVW